MRDKNFDHTCTGSDYYFEKAIQYPEFTPSSWSISTNRKYFLLPSTLRNEAEARRYNNGPTTHASRSSWHHWKSMRKDFRESPTSSPGSTGTSKTSDCTDDDESHCGSLTYSVESWTLEPLHPADEMDEIDEGYHAEDEDTAGLENSSSSLYQHEDDCFIGNPCFQPFAWVQIMIQESLQKPSSLPQDVPRP